VRPGHDLERTGSQAPLHPIGVVARRTGITLHVLRAWERRYAVVAPERTAGGQRLYSDADIERLRLLRQVTEAGHGISQVAHLSDAELAGLVSADAERSGAPAEETAGEFREACLAAGERMDGEAVQAALMRGVVSLRPREFMGEVLLPVLREVGERWHAGRIGPAHEHVVSQAARRVLHWLLDAYDAQPGSPVLLTTTPAGELHEFGAMAASAVGMDEGWRVIYLGASLPAGEVVRAARQVRASIVALSVVSVPADDAVVAEVSALAAHVPAGVPLVVGGAGAAAQSAALQDAGAQVLPDLDALRDMLRVRKRLARESI
jgi:MerR family transcriptional regulator, light-induced transcriptional regulator